MTRAKTQRPRDKARTGPVPTIKPPPPKQPPAPPLRSGTVVPPPAGSKMASMVRPAPPAPPPRTASVARTSPPTPPPGKRAARAASSSVIEAQLVAVTELPALRTLQIAVHEGVFDGAAAAQAIASAGHAVVASAAGEDGIETIKEAITDGGLDAVIIGLPGGEPLIDAALALEPRRPVVIAAVGGPAADAIARAQASGADLVVVRPHDAERLAPVLLAVARMVDLRREVTNARGSEAVLRSRLEDLTDANATGLQPFALFKRALEVELKRTRRYKYPLAVAMFAVDVPPPAPPPGLRGILRARAGNTLIHAIRDIDIVTEIDQERFLVLLPYTELVGAAGLARRVIAEVEKGQPVVAMGRSFAPKLVGAVAGAKPGQQLSFAKLMKDVTRALEQARKDGAELAVAT